MKLRKEYKKNINGSLDYLVDHWIKKNSSLKNKKLSNNLINSTSNMLVCRKSYNGFSQLTPLNSFLSYKNHRNQHKRYTF